MFAVLFKLTYFSLLCNLSIQFTPIDIGKAYRDELRRQLAKSPISDLALCIANIDKMNISNLKTRPKEALGDYLGRGYDLLTGETKLSVFGETYQNCNTSADFKYFVPDFYRAEKLYIGNVEKSTSICTSTQEYKSASNAGGSVGGSGSGGGKTMGGSFSASQTEAKTNIEKSDTSMIMVKAEIVLYQLLGSPAASFNGAFLSRIQAIVNATRDRLPRTARYLIEEIYRDYGTEVVMNAKLGVKIERRVYVSNSYMKASSEKQTSFKMGLEASMTKQNEKKEQPPNTQGGKASVSFESIKKSVEEMSQVDKTDVISVWGGPDYSAMSSDSMEDFLKLDHVAALSRETEPLYRMMHGGALSPLSMTTDEITKLRMEFQYVYDEIMERNVYRGCMNPEYYNFDFQANVDDNSCDGNRCSFTDINFNCGVTRKLCNKNKASYLETQFQLDVNALEFYDEYYDFEKDSILKMTDEKDKEEFQTWKGSVVRNRDKIHKIFDKLIDCNYTKFASGKPNATFFANANSLELQACIKQGQIVEMKDNTYQLKTCNNTIPSDWDVEPTPTGFFQTCEPLEATTKFDEDLEKLKQPRPSPCTHYRTNNIVTGNQSCPINTTKELVMTFVQVLPDFYAVYKDYVHDPEDEGNYQVYTYQITLKDSVNISTYWCRSNTAKKSGIYFGGLFGRKHRNSYIAAEGCQSGMKDMLLFYDTIFCVSIKPPTGGERNLTPELRYMYSSQSVRAVCPSKTSKQLATVINGVQVFACIYKKLGYSNAPTPRPIELPFRDFINMVERRAESTLVYFNDPNRTFYETIPLAAVQNELYLTIQDKTREMNAHFFGVPTTTIKPDALKDNFHKSNNLLIFIIIAASLLVIIVAVACVYVIQK
uniref:Macrophage-expressed gene 1 protein n=2 Tax=Panagrellus redivivus TaxID=6233 RepID=A0A7E4VRV2_PANRE